MKKYRHRKRQPAAVTVPVNVPTGTLEQIVTELERRIESKVGNVSDLDERLALMANEPKADSLRINQVWRACDDIAIRQWASAKARLGAI